MPGVRDLFRTLLLFIFASLIPIFIMIYFGNINLGSHTIRNHVEVFMDQFGDDQLSPEEVLLQSVTPSIETQLEKLGLDLDELAGSDTKEDTDDVAYEAGSPVEIEYVDENAAVYENAESGSQSGPNGTRVNLSIVNKVFPKTLDYSNLYNSSSSFQFFRKKAIDTAYYTKKRTPATKKNILFLVVDDLRAQINAYKEFTNLFPEESFRMHTPNLDKFADKSLVLTRAFVQYSSCNPSRSSYMTSRRPDTTHIWDLHHYWRESGGNFTTIPQYFKENGYRTAGIGKIYHPGKGGGFGDPLSWNEGYNIPKHGGYWSQKSTTADFALPVNEATRIENPLPDEEMTIRTVQRLREFHEEGLSGERPFFLAVGFMKPHLPIVFPEEFLDLYPDEDMCMPNNPYVPVNLNEKSFYPPHEVLHCADVARTVKDFKMNTTFPENFARYLRRTYFSGVSYIDYLIGIVLDELESLGLADNTIVTFMGDHGWHLGENGYWGKHTNFDLGLQAPLMLHIPGKTDHGLRSNSLVEFTDFFPTLVEAAGYEQLTVCPKYSNDIALCTEGKSFLRLIEEPKAEIREYVYSQHRFMCWAMAYSVRTDQYRYTETIMLNDTRTGQDQYRIDIIWDTIVGAELFNYKNDPQGNINLAYEEKYAKVRTTLSENLRSFNGDNIPNVPHKFC